MITVTVESRVAQGGRLQQDQEPVVLTLLTQEITVADLIRRTVEEQVRQLNARRRLQDDNWPDETAGTGSEVEASFEVERAKRAFSNGEYAVLINGRPALRLEDTLTFAPGTQIHFLRVTPLVGG